VIGLYILGGMLLFGAFKFLRGVYFIRKAKRLEGEIATLNGCRRSERAHGPRRFTGRSRCSIGLYPCHALSDPSRSVAVKPVGMENPVAVDTRFLKP
jgi:hypothetical protein